MVGTGAPLTASVISGKKCCEGTTREARGGGVGIVGWEWVTWSHRTDSRGLSDHVISFEQNSDQVNHESKQIYMGVFCVPSTQSGRSIFQRTEKPPSVSAGVGDSKVEETEF